MTRPLRIRAPTFTETMALASVNGNSGGVFKASMDYIPQLAQYSNLYRQYRINWAKVLIIPQQNVYDGSHTLTAQGMPRITWAINDTPGVANPASENDLLEDNGAKTRALVSKWSASFRPMPDLQVTEVATGGLVPINFRRRFLNFKAGNTGNPLHYGISYWISQSLAGGVQPGSFNVYLKINFSLRDPQ